MMYTNFFVKKYSILQSMTKRSVTNESKREESIKGDSEDEEVLPRKRKSGGLIKTSVNYREIRISGLESLSELEPIVQTDSPNKYMKDE